MKRMVLASVVALLSGASSVADTSVPVAALDADVKAFLTRELTAHVADIGTFDPPPGRIVGSPTTGEFSWGTFGRAVAAYGQLTGAERIGNRNLVRTAADIGLLEVKLGGTRFSQLYGALSLWHYGAELSKNRLWQSLTPDEQKKWRFLLDATRFYDPVKREVIDLPENYLGVASRIAAIAWATGLLEDRALLDSLLERAAVQFTSGALYADDALPTGRYDRYSNEYARYVWEAAQIAGRKDLMDAVRPSLKTQMRLWWDLLSPDGYGYQWGRSLGVVSYLDTLEIAGFLALNPEFRPAPLEQLAAAYYRAWQWLRKDFKDSTHLLSVFDYGRGNYSYISKDREWQQTAGFFGKLAHAHIQLMTGVRGEGVLEFPAMPALPRAARFEFFARTGRQAGVWAVRHPGVAFALPITTGTKPGVADYLPAPHGLAGFAAPVEQVTPALTPFLRLADGRTLVAADGADAIEPSADGRGVKARWSHWAVLDGKPSELVDAGLTSEVEWRLDGTALTRTERLSATRQVAIQHWSVNVPTTANQWRTITANGTRTDHFTGREGRLSVTIVKADWPQAISVRASEDTPLGRGARGSIPLHMNIESTDLGLLPGAAKSWVLQLHVEAP
jgi:hypothetical protein